ncbi:hypothetical protein GALMADRAFT_71556 [Galerina marginata CBS 339.88]|uniref:Peptidase C14 caspase domain-containing protein n=1 Tax=Galerina marginata (strain CBS 339.88) TaxID=685588 RepID=A0A067T4Z6_GALM3|nr:hypothetical protein GALMADRAFT_71556 [Galerina marginata CBS 339.88]
MSDSGVSSTQSLPKGLGKPPLFALIIGINKYKSNFRSLRGAEADALAFKNYLEHSLKVPGNQILFLFNEDATRANIIDAFARLANDSRIEKGDAIVIFFAGHGSEIPPVDYPGWEAGGPDNKIQMIVPYDYCEERGREVRGLPDRIIGSLIDRIAERKGDNITVIFDCCNAASGTRSLKSDESSVLTRSIEVHPNSYDPEHDRGIWDTGTRGTKRAENRFRHAGLESHMLIAACGSAELAKESYGRGEFSTAFLKLLNTHPPDKLRYRDILTHMDAIPSQNPQCEGINQDRILFDAKVVPPSRAIFPVNFMKSNTGGLQLVLDAGSAQGITTGAEFAIYPPNNDERQTQVGVATVASVGAFRSILTSPDSLISQPYVAVQTKTGQKEDFRLFSPSGDSFHDVYKSIHENADYDKYNLHNITLVNSPSIAHLGATVENNKVIFEMKDEKVTRHGFYHRFTPLDATDLDSVAWVLNRAAHFYWELNRANSDARSTSIRVEFYKLKETKTEADELEYGEYCPLQPDLCQNQIVNFTVDDEDAPYGLKLINNTTHDFYPYLFYFDNSDLSITPYYVTPEARHYRGDIPLKKTHGSLTLGYGSGGVGPFSYALRQNQDVDVGFLKLFVSTKPIDLSHVPQPSPFEATRALKSFSPKPKDAWDTVLIPIIQRRNNLTGS